jgi:uncharacterized membrane protein YbhN (UPF0104 family)
MPTYLGISFNSVLPGNVGGDFVRLYYLIKKFPSQKSNAVLSICVDRICGLLGILLIIFVLSPFYVAMLIQNKLILNFLLTLTGIIIIAGIVFITLPFLIKKILNHQRSSKIFDSFIESVRIYRNAKYIIFESVIVSVLVQVLLLVVTIQITQMMGLPVVSLTDLILALAIAQIANLLPLTPGGLGVGEAAFVNVLLLLNSEATASYGTVFFALRLISILAYLPGIIFGIFGFNLLHSRKYAPLIKE